MGNGATWKKLTDEQHRLIGNPSDELTALKIENARLILASQCFEQAVDKCFDSLGAEKLGYVKLLRESRAETQHVREAIKTLIEAISTAAFDLNGITMDPWFQGNITVMHAVTSVMERLHQLVGDYQ